MDEAISELVRLRDPVGVLSVYVDIDPGAEAHPRPTWQIELDNGITGIEHALRAEGDRGRKAAFSERLRALEPELAGLVDPRAFGRGRTLFAAVGSGAIRKFALQTPLPTNATFGGLAHVIPLLRVDDGLPRAIVLVGHDRVRVLEAALGSVRELESLDVEAVVYDHAERKGPVASNPLRRQKAVAQRERWEKHVEADHHRRLSRVSAHLSRLAHERGWKLGVVAGDPRGANQVVAALEAAHVLTEVDDRDLVDVSPARAQEELDPLLKTAADRRNLWLAERARDAAAAGGPGAAGLASVVAALEQGLVEELVLDGERQMEGGITADGRLAPAEAGISVDPQFADRLVAGAVTTAAGVSVVGGAIAAALADVDGVAAILRTAGAGRKPLLGSEQAHEQRDG